MMESLVRSGHAFDVVIAFTALEFVILTVLWRRAGRGVAPGSIIANLGAAAGLLLAARAQAMDAEWFWVAAALILALVCHLADLARQWRWR